MELISEKHATAVFESIANVARAGGLWSQDTALVVGELARGLSIAPELPMALPSVTTVNVRPLNTVRSGKNGRG